jgi:hypothetical protein
VFAVVALCPALMKSFVSDDGDDMSCTCRLHCMPLPVFLGLWYVLSMCGLLSAAAPSAACHTQGPRVCFIVCRQHAFKLATELVSCPCRLVCCCFESEGFVCSRCCVMAHSCGLPWGEMLSMTLKHTLCDQRCALCVTRRHASCS